MPKFKILPGIKPKVPHDVARRDPRRPHFSIQLEAIGPWHRREIAVVQVPHQAGRGGHLAPLDPIGIADPARGYRPGAVQEHRQQLAVVASHDRFEILQLRTVVRFDVAEGGDDEANLILRRGVERRGADGVHELPESGRAEVEYRSRQIDRGVIIEQPPWHDANSAFATVSLPAAGAPWRKSSFMRDQ